MEVSFRCGRETIMLRVPDDTIVYKSTFPSATASAAETVMTAINKPIGTQPLPELLAKRDSGDVAVVVSDFTRPIPYRAFLPQLLARIQDCGVPREEILILIATGMHHPCTRQEHLDMFGKEIADSFRIISHEAENPTELIELPETSRSGNAVRLNRHYVNAGFRFITGLVEPHFMAGFSGGRKSVCPGIASLDSLRTFHGYGFLSDHNACNGVLENNPLHEEALSVAAMLSIDYSLNVVLNNDHEVISAYGGSLEGAHSAACDFVRRHACPVVEEEADVVITSSGGYPLDATFYQCVKGLVSCLPAVKRDGIILAVGGCSEGIGSKEYIKIMKEYEGRWRDFIERIKESGEFIKDQWEFQMHCRALDKVGQENLIFVSDGLSREQLDCLSVNGIDAPKEMIADILQDTIQQLLQQVISLAVFPEGPYCAPTKYTG